MPAKRKVRNRGRPAPKSQSVVVIPATGGPPETVAAAPSNGNYELGRAASSEEREMLAKREQFQQLVLSAKQFKILFQPTPKYAIRHREGPGKRMLDYIPHGYAEDRLNKAFGLDWDFNIIPNAFGGQPYHLEIEEIALPKGGTKISRNVTVMGQLTVRVRDPREPDKVLTVITKTEFGSNPWNTGIEFGDALKAAASDAFKRCALRCGVALDLYYDDEMAQTEYEEKLRKAADLDTRLAEARVRIQPATLPELLVRANENWGMDAMAVVAALHETAPTVNTLPDLANWFVGNTAEVWSALLAYIDTQHASAAQQQEAAREE